MKNRTSRPVRFPELRFVSPSGSAADCRPKPGRGSHQRNEFLYRHLRRADQRAQRSRSYLAMLWDRQACRLSRLDENHMACALAVLDPARLLENSHRPLPREGGQSRHLRRNLNFSDLNCQRHATSRACFETPSNGFADVVQGLGFRAPLGNAARNGRALRNKHAGLVRFQRHEQLHTWILQHLACAAVHSGVSEHHLQRVTTCGKPRLAQ